MKQATRAFGLESGRFRRDKTPPNTLSPQTFPDAPAHPSRAPVGPPPSTHGRRCCIASTTIRLHRYAGRERLLSVRQETQACRFALCLGPKLLDAPAREPLPFHRDKNLFRKRR